MKAGLIHYSTFDTGPGDKVFFHELNPVDLSRAWAIMVEIKLTKADTDALDLFDVRFQETSDRVAWHTRARSIQFTGDLSPTPATPEYYRLVVNQIVDLAATEEAYEPSGSLGASELSAGSVLNGPFPGKYRDKDTKEWKPNARLRFEVSGDADSDADFEGEVRIYALSLD